MSDTTPNTESDGIRENAGPPSGDDVRDEVRLNLDEERLDTWDDVRGDYAVDPESDVARPALTESEEAENSEGSDSEDDLSPADEDDEEDTLAEDEDVHEEE